MAITYPGQEGLIVDEIFSLLGKLKPGQRIAVAQAVLNANNMAALAAQLAIDKFPDTEVSLILEIVKATIEASTPPCYP